MFFGSTLAVSLLSLRSIHFSITNQIPLTKTHTHAKSTIEKKRQDFFFSPQAATPGESLLFPLFDHFSPSSANEGIGHSTRAPGPTFAVPSVVVVSSCALLSPSFLSPPPLLPPPPPSPFSSDSDGSLAAASPASSSPSPRAVPGRGGAPRRPGGTHGPGQRRRESPKAP